jgi:hypothetical protein
MNPDGRISPSDRISGPSFRLCNVSDAKGEDGKRRFHRPDVVGYSTRLCPCIANSELRFSLADSLDFSGLLDLPWWP